tara:strand:- start:46 stop:534 length:489 start_codon:yes stop_codon:yes gene_type:complete
MKIVTGVELEHDPLYLQKRKYHTKDGIDQLIGFHPNCIQKAIADNKEVVKEEAKRISVDLELPIFDDVEYKLEGQILKINIGEPKMKPLMQHMGALLMKCGSGLIDTSGWLSFVSSDSNDIRNSRNQQCHYNYFQNSNDKKALELFKAVLSGTNSIFDYLKK